MSAELIECATYPGHLDSVVHTFARVRAMLDIGDSCDCPRARSWTTAGCRKSRVAIVNSEVIRFTPADLVVHLGWNPGTFDKLRLRVMDALVWQVFLDSASVVQYMNDNLTGEIQLRNAVHDSD